MNKFVRLFAIISIITVPAFALDLILGAKRAASEEQTTDSTAAQKSGDFYMDSAQVAELEGIRGQTMTGQRSRTSIMRGIDKNSNTIHKEYNNHVRAGNRITGAMIVRLKIVSNGDVIECKIVESNTGDIVFEKNVVLSIKRWKFPPIEIENDTTVVEYPFVFGQL
jgi:TonB family protein